MLDKVNLLVWVMAKPAAMQSCTILQGISHLARLSDLQFGARVTGGLYLLWTLLWQALRHFCPAQMGRSQGEKPAGLGSQHERAGSYLGRVMPAVSEDAQQEPRAEVALDLGPLGNFLLAR